MTWTTFADYVRQQEDWLEMESRAEKERLIARRKLEKAGEAERSGETILALHIADHRLGLAGRILLDLAKAGGKPIPLNRLRVGSPVILSEDGSLDHSGISGVISKRTSSTIQVAVESWPESNRLRLDLSPDETTRRRQLSALAKARLVTGRRARLRDTLLGFQPPRFDREENFPFQQTLNPPQQAAVRFALSASDLAIIHGPPGTGKTTTLAEIIYQAAQRGERILACAPSNTAVDNLLERLVDMMPSVLRVGHPARVMEALRHHTLDELVEAEPSTKVVQEMWREVEMLMRSAGKKSRSRDANRRRGELYAEAGRLRKEARSLERRIINHVVDSADVICTTTTIDDDLLGERAFDLVVIDEACQCTEPALWQAMLRAERMILAGDHCQLPPTVVSAEAARQGLARSSMERLVEQFGDDVFRRLIVQYRMHEQIMRFSSQQFYDDELVADISVKRHTLPDLPTVEPTDGTVPVLEFWDTAGAGWEEEVEEDGLSKRNRREAKWIVSQVRALLEAGVSPSQIAIIAPYAAQVRLLRNRLQISDLEIDTVDGFQGREKEIVLVTLVRSNSAGTIGFLADTRRTNVALTRARRSLRVIGDSATLSSHPFYHALIEYFETNQAYRTVWELDAAV